MRRNQIASRPGVQRDVKQMPGVQAKNRAAVRGEVADLTQCGRDHGRRVQCRGIEQVMHLAGAIACPVDSRYLGAEQETHRLLTTRWRVTAKPAGQLRAKLEQAWLRGLQRLAKFLGPARMGEVAGADDRDPLPPRPPGQTGNVAVLAACAREPRVNVQVSVEHLVSAAAFWRRCAGRPSSDTATLPQPGRGVTATRRTRPAWLRGNREGVIRALWLCATMHKCGSLPDHPKRAQVVRPDAMQAGPMPALARRSSGRTERSVPCSATWPH